MRRIYSITPEGKSILGDAKGKVRELFGELFEAPENLPMAATDQET